LQRCFEAIEKLSGERVTVTGAGRTDAGVHALGQVAHFELEKIFPAEKVREALNFHLKPDPVAVLEAAEAAPDAGGISTCFTPNTRATSAACAGPAPPKPTMA